MSGTPTVGNSVLSAEGALAQLERLLSFLREPTYGVGPAALSPYDEIRERSGNGQWQRDMSKPMARLEAAVVGRLEGLLQPLMVRHTKADLRLPEPIWLPTHDASLSKVEGESELAFTARVCRGAATHIIETMRRAREEWRRQEATPLSPRGRGGGGAPRRAPPPKAVVFSEFENDLEQASPAAS